MKTIKLPHESNYLFITDGGLETTAIYRDGIELPAFSSIHLMRSDRGIKYLENYFSEFVELAKKNNVGLILETPTWRASADWAEQLNATPQELSELTKQAAELLCRIRDKHADANVPMVVAGSLGPRGDGYKSGRMTADEAKEYHLPHIEALKDGGADFVSALTLTYPEEAVGVIEASRSVGIPVVVSFTVETDGRLPNGDDYLQTVEKVDKLTDGYVSYFMINCAHPTHFSHIFESDSPVIKRIAGIRANASCKSHEELDNSTTLDIGNPHELGEQIVELRRRNPNLKVLGGCCGTDIRHIHQICNAMA